MKYDESESPTFINATNQKHNMGSWMQYLIQTNKDALMFGLSLGLKTDFKMAFKIPLPDNVCLLVRLQF